MKILKKLLFLIIPIFLLVGCDSIDINKFSDDYSKDTDKLKNKTISALSDYLNTEIDTKKFSYNLDYKDALIEAETNNPIYKGDRLSGTLKEKVKDLGIISFVGEFGDKDTLLKLFKLVYTPDGSISETEAKKLAEKFIYEKNLETKDGGLVFLSKEASKDKSIDVVKFKSKNLDIIKVYINNYLKEVVGFSLYDTPDF